MVLGTMFGNHLLKGWLNGRGSGRMDRSQTITSDTEKQQTFRLFIFPAIRVIIKWKGIEPEAEGDSLSWATSQEMGFYCLSS